MEPYDLRRVRSSLWFAFIHACLLVATISLFIGAVGFDNLTCIKSLSDIHIYTTNIARLGVTTLLGATFIIWIFAITWIFSIRTTTLFRSAKYKKVAIIMIMIPVISIFAWIILVIMVNVESNVNKHNINKRGRY